MVDGAHRKLAENVLRSARANRLKIAAAESCTGGLVSAALTDIPGSSDVVERGFVTYSNEAKMQMLGVPDQTLRDHGAVSEATARAMAQGALANSHADLSVAITGVAGPGGGSEEKPVGLVHFAVARKGHDTISEKHLFGDIGRTAVREASVDVALNLLLRLACA
jgi:nicotinamide-nucleotide amidase